MILPFSRRALFFNEGPGFLLIRHLGQGRFGSASLVQSIKDGQSYVRKEELIPTSTTLKDGTPLSAREVRDALAANHIDGVVKLKGWTQYINNITGQKFMVTYWNFCNGGTLYEFLTGLEKHKTNIPEAWVAQWLITMLDTMLALHAAGIAHNDGHANNWFLHHNEGARYPYEIGLGDLGLCKREKETSKWYQTCRDDFMYIIQDVIPFLGLERDACGEISPTTCTGRRCSNFMLAKMQQFDQKLWTQLTLSGTIDGLHRHMKEISDSVKLYLTHSNTGKPGLLLSTSSQEEQQTSWRKAMRSIHKNPSAYKCWRVAYVKRRRGRLPMVKLQHEDKEADQHFEPLATGNWDPPVGLK